MDTAASLGAWLVSIDLEHNNDVTVTRKEYSGFYLISQLNWFSSILLSANFIMLAYEFEEYGRAMNSPELLQMREMFLNS